MKKVILHVATAIMLATSTIGMCDTIDLFILAGQSNARGINVTSDNPYPLQYSNADLDGRIYISYAYDLQAVGSFINCNGYDTGSGGRLVQRTPWRRLIPQETWHGPGYFGPEVSFARNLKNIGFNPYIFKYTPSQASLVHEWIPSINGQHADVMIEHLILAINELKNEGHTVIVRGMLWVQGSADSHCQFSIDSYKGAFQYLMSDIKRRLGIDSLPAIIGFNDRPLNSNNNHYAILGGVKPVMLEIARGDASIGTHFFSNGINNYFPYRVDSLHLDTLGRVIHGDNLFREFMTSIEPYSEYVQLQSDMVRDCINISSTSNNSTLKTSRCFTDAAMFWTIDDLGNNEVRIRNTVTNYCIYSPPTHNALAKQAVCSNDSKFTYIREPLFEGFRYRHKDSNWCLYNRYGKVKSWGCWNDKYMVYHERPYNYMNSLGKASGRISGNSDSRAKLTMECLDTGQKCTLIGNRSSNTCRIDNCPTEGRIKASCSTNTHNREVDYMFYRWPSQPSIDCPHSNCLLTLDGSINSTVEVNCHITD